MGTHPIFESDFDCLTEMEVDENEDNNHHKRSHSPSSQESSCKRARYENELERMMSDTSLSGNETDNARKNDQSLASTRKIQIRRKKIKKKPKLIRKKKFKRT